MNKRGSDNRRAERSNFACSAFNRAFCRRIKRFIFNRNICRKICPAYNGAYGYTRYRGSGGEGINCRKCLRLIRAFCTENGTGFKIFGIQKAHGKLCKQQAEHKLENSLKNLTDGGGHHIHMPFGERSFCRSKRGKKHRGSKRKNGNGAFG